MIQSRSNSIPTEVTAPFNIESEKTDPNGAEIQKSSEPSPCVEYALEIDSYYTRQCLVCGGNNTIAFNLEGVNDFLCLTCNNATIQVEDGQAVLSPNKL